MSKKTKKAPTVITREERIMIGAKVAVGTFPGQNRSRKFTDRKKQANRRACRGRVKW